MRSPPFTLPGASTEAWLRCGGIDNALAIGVLLITGLPFSTCAPQPPDERVCPDVFVYGVSAFVENADTGTSITDAVLTLTEGDYSEVMQFIPARDYYVGAGERPGSYTLTIEVPGVASATVPNLVVGFDGCHVSARGLDAEIRPGQIIIHFNAPD